jgi:hypothetical protein
VAVSTGAAGLAVASNRQGDDHVIVLDGDLELSGALAILEPVEVAA